MQSDWSLFFGRFHPLIVHIPVGIILFAALLSLISVYRKSPALSSAIDIALLAGAFSAVLAALSGYLLSAAGGYNEDTLSWHKWMGIAATATTWLAWFTRRKKERGKTLLRLKMSNGALCVSVLLILTGSHLGGRMTHGEEYLTRYMPGFLKSLFAVKKSPAPEKKLPALDSVIVYRDIIQPILNQHCISCHNGVKRKGDLNLTTIEAVLKGGKSGNTIVAANPEKSELFHRITLTPRSSKFMPQDNRAPLTPIEIYFIKQWIESGATYQKTILESGTEEKVKFMAAVYLGITMENQQEIHLPDVPPADPAVLRTLKDAGIIIQPLTSGSNLLEVSFVMEQHKPAAEISGLLRQLSAVKKQVYRLDISNCGLTLEEVALIAGFSRLNRLNIQKNNLRDESFTLLAGLPELEWLNAGQNPLTDKSLPVVEKLKSLKKINLWQTEVTEEAVKDWQSRLPGLVIER